MCYMRPLKTNTVKQFIVEFFEIRPIIRIRGNSDKLKLLPIFVNKRNLAGLIYEIIPNEVFL